MRFRLNLQLLVIIIASYLILFIAFSLAIPRVIRPVAEGNLYNYLNDYISFIDDINISNFKDDGIVYFYKENDKVYKSSKFMMDNNDIYSKLVGKKGKFIYKNNLYYYVNIEKNNITRSVISNDLYIKNTNKKIIDNVAVTIFIIAVLISVIIIIWSSRVVTKIYQLKSKIDNFVNDKYNNKYIFLIDDEFRDLNNSIDDMMSSFMEMDEYRNNLYQNITHDFKTPLSVMKSYIEAREDLMVSEEKYNSVIKEQCEKLEKMVRTLLYLNKLDYLNGNSEVSKDLVDVTGIIRKQIDKFKYYNKNVKFKIKTDDSFFIGGEEIFETVFDNILSNFMRYAKCVIKITISNNKIIFYNDGEKINEKFLYEMFSPFKKSINGDFGVGLSIVKKSLEMMGYDIKAQNEKKGVSFIIIKKKSTNS